MDFDRSGMWWSFTAVSYTHLDVYKRQKLCRLTLMPSNVLILDEPTNHLDELAKEALKEALVKYEGTVILVSHEERFYRDWTDKVISMEK